MSTAPNESLVLGEPPAAYTASEAVGQFTGERIFSGNRRLYNAIVALIGRATPYREIAEICSVSVNTVCAVSAREGTPIETIRERIGRLGLDVSLLTIEAIRDLLADPIARAKLTAKDLAIVHGIVTTNAQLVLGGATMRMETMEGTPSLEDYLRYVRAVTEVTATSLDGTTAPQKAGAPTVGPGAQATLPAAPVIEIQSNPTPPSTPST